MRDITSCFSEYSINVSNPSCSSYPNNNCIVSQNHTCAPSIQNIVTSLYKISLPNNNQKHFMIKTTWCNKTNSINSGLTITFNNDSSTCFKLNTNSRLFRKKKGSKILDTNDAASSKIELFWDLSTAKYSNGPEPIAGFYLLIMIDSEIGLVLGDLAEESSIKKLKNGSSPVSKCSLVSRTEHFSALNAYHYTTKAQFSDTGTLHDILIRCNGEEEGLKSPVLSISIDKKTVIRVKRLQWNFRGNQTIFVDGLVVDLMWDICDWVFNNSNNNNTNSSSNGFGVFMFRTRSGLDSRLWLEERILQKDQDRVDFSLLIYGSRNYSV